MASQTVTATPTPTSYSGTAANVDWGGTASGFTIPAGNSILGIKFLLVGAGYDNGIMFAQTLVVNGKDLSSYVNPSGTVDYWGDGAIHASSPTQLWGQLWTRAEVNADLAIAVRSYNTPAAAYNAALTGIQAVVYYDVTTTDPAHTTASVPAGIVGATTEIVVTARDSSNVPRGSQIMQPGKFIIIYLILNV